MISRSKTNKYKNLLTTSLTPCYRLTSKSRFEENLFKEDHLISSFSFNYEAKDITFNNPKKQSSVWNSSSLLPAKILFKSIKVQASKRN